jgi:hypothetical protein
MLDPEMSSTGLGGSLRSEDWPCAYGTPTTLGILNNPSISVTIAVPNENDYFYVSAPATITMQNATIPSASQPRVAVTAIESVEWEGADYSRAVENAQDIKMHLAELLTPGSSLKDNYYYFDDENIYSVFPTFSPKTGEENLNQARVVVTLAANIPQGMAGTVHLSWFDPKDYAPSHYSILEDDEYWLPNSSGDGNVLKDNCTGLSFANGTSTLTFSNDQNFTTSNVRKAIVEFTEDCFGDNFIVAAHPNLDIAGTYHFKDDIDDQASDEEKQEQGKTLLRPQSQAVLETNLRTSVLHVAAWNGFKVPKDWIYNEALYSIETETIDTILAKGGESYAKSVLKLNAFELNIQYDFDRSRGDDGYVLPSTQTGNPKLSFVANSGVKIGSILGASAGAYEISILDMDAMVDLAGGIDSFKNNQVLQANSVNTCQIYVQNYTDEPLNCLMNGIGYGKEYSKMEPYVTASTNADSNVTLDQYWEKFWNTLNNNVDDTNLYNNMTINYDLNKKLSVTLNSQTDYFVDQSPASLNNTTTNDGHLYLQSHWGSGVVFASATITCFN